MPSNPPHHRSGAALYFIISGAGANIISGAGANIISGTAANTVDAVDILGLQHQSGRCGSRASGRTSKGAIANGGRPTATLPVTDFIMANDCSIARMDSSTTSSEKLRHERANLSHGGNERAHRGIRLLQSKMARHRCRAFFMMCW
jgi:hypothetical protein